MTGFADDELLAYAKSRRQFSLGERLIFDEAYRYAQLPLIAPWHPAVINHPHGLDYKVGRYDAQRYSLVIPVRHAVLASSYAFQEVDNRLRQSSFSDKISFDLCDVRRSLQHVTIAGGFDKDDLPKIEAIVRDSLRQSVSVAYQLKGPFIGSKNFGRLYFPAYPALHGGVDAYALLQQAIGARQSGFYAMGFYNFIDELDVPETRELQAILDDAANEVMVEAVPEELCLIATNDDLVLSGQILMRIET